MPTSRGRRAILVTTCCALLLGLLATVVLRDHLRQQVEREYTQLEVTAHLTAAWLQANLLGPDATRCETALDARACGLLLDQLGPPRPLSVAIFDERGVLLGRVPAVPERVGQPLRHPVTDAFLGSDLLVQRFRTTSPLDGTDAFFVIRRVEETSLVIVVGAPVSTILPELRQRVVLVVGVLLLLLLLGVALLRHYLAGLRLDEEVRRTNAVLRETEQRFLALFNGAAGMAVQGVRPDGTVFFWNEGSERLYGHRAEDMEGEEGVSLLTNPDERESGRALVASLLAGDAASPVRELTVRHADGHPVHVLSHHVVFRPKDRPPEIFCVDMDLTRLKALEEKLREQATTDELTHLWNRRYFLRRARREIALARRKKRPLAVLMLDLDHFKSVNDTHGHAVGDAALVEVSRRLRDNLRETDMLARLGGEEFTALLPETDPETAQAVAERLRTAIAERPLDVSPELALPITISIGVASLSAPEDDLDALLTRADRALYRAKRGGRNQVRTMDDSETGDLP